MELLNRKIKENEQKLRDHESKVQGFKQMAIGRQTQYGFKNTLEEKQYPPPKAATQSNFFLGGGVPEKSTEQVKPAYYNKREA